MSRFHGVRLELPTSCITMDGLARTGQDITKLARMLSVHKGMSPPSVAGMFGFS